MNGGRVVNIWDPIKVAGRGNKGNICCYCYGGLTLTLGWCNLKNMSQYYTSQQIHPYERNHGVGVQPRRAFCLGQYVSISGKTRNTYSSYQRKTAYVYISKYRKAENYSS